MHGLVNRSMECFVVDTYGVDAWCNVVSAAGLDFQSFEALLPYDDAVTEAVVIALSAELRTPTDILLTDIGTYLVSHRRMAAVRRLLRFGGETFTEFLFSLDDMQDRVRLAVSDLPFPTLELQDHMSSHYTLKVTHRMAGAGHVLLGMLRAMADDYGSLAFLEHKGRVNQTETVTIEVVQTDFAEGRAFALAGHT